MYEQKEQVLRYSSEEIVRNDQEAISLSSHERTVAFIADEIERRGIFRLYCEFCPIYAYPSTDPEYYTQQYNSQEFKRGSQLGNRILCMVQETMPGIEVVLWTMVDDVNGLSHPWLITDEVIEENNNPIPWIISDDIAEDSGGMDANIISNTLNKIQQSTGSLRIFEEIDPQTTFLESDFLTEERNRCASLDAAFVMAQIRHVMALYSTVGENAISRYAFSEVLFPKVHPIGFGPEQKLTYQKVLGEMKSDPIFKKMSKKERRNLIESLFIHIWIDENGEVASITKPKWDEKKSQFTFQEVEF